MERTVKHMFMLIAATAIILVCGQLIAEMFNISVTGLQVNEITNLACKKSCQLFGQESYKIRYSNGGTVGGTTSANDVYDSAGSVYVSGKFYGSNTSQTEIYDSLYTNSDFKNWCKSDIVANQGKWKSVELINEVLNNPSVFDGIDETSTKFADKELAETYKDTLVTPLNMGIPYLDKATLQKMFRWSLAKLMATDTSAVVVPASQSDTGKSYVRYKGFRVYAADAVIKSVEYKVYDLSTSDGREGFNKITSINPDKLKFGTNVSVGSLTSDERSRVCLAGITYYVPIEYEGITSLKNVISYAWSHDVQGTDSSQRRQTLEDIHFTSDSNGLTAGGFSGSTITDGVLPVPGKLVYYVVR